MQKIRTTYMTTADGKGKIVAKGEGKQRTSTYDHSKSIAANHGQAAALLGDVLKWRKSDDLSHEETSVDGHIFINHTLKRSLI